MVSLNCIANVQPSFVPSDMPLIKSRVPKSLLPHCYAWKTMADEGVWVAGGSDAPVESHSPLLGIQDAMRREGREGEFEGVVLGESQRLNFARSLWMYTVAGAYACGSEEDLGDVSVGYRGDAVVVDCSARDGGWRDISVAAPYAVVVDGEIVAGSGKGSGGKGEKFDGLGCKAATTTPLSRAANLPGKNGRFPFRCACCVKGYF